VIQFGQHPAPSHVVAHISDAHLLADGKLQFGAIDTVAQLKQAFARLRRINPRPQALVFTGDLTDIGEPKAYQELRVLTEALASEINAHIIWVMGNHDERSVYSRELFDKESTGPQDRIYDIDGLRIIALDSTVPGYHHGKLANAQLKWLREQLATPAPHGTVVALHHPPIPVPLVPASAIIELYDQQKFWEALAGSDVRAVIGGHFHYNSHTTYRGVTVSVAAATCYSLDTAPHQRLVSGVDGAQGFNMLHIYDDRIVHTVVPLEDAREVDGHPAEALDLISPLSNEQRRELLSNKSSPYA
jgi:3',5'-cyclic-AMP phosphodiesterase